VLAAPTVGQPAPALVVETLGGHTLDLSALRGKVVIVNFWATWCAPCREEMPTLDSFYRRYRKQGLELIAMSADSPDDVADVRKVMQAFAYPAAMVDKARSNGFGFPQMLPVTYVIDSKGVVRAVLRPDKIKITEKSLAEVVLPLLGASGKAKAETTSSGERKIPSIGS
jgi:cytochrome c biogenesis protein CcmG, thiol:disulfide interchange protein DsbE